MKFIPCLIFVSLTTYSVGQKKDTLLILPDSKTLESDKLKEYKASYDFFSVRDGEEKRVGGIDDHFQVLTEGKTKKGLRVCKISFGTNTILDSGLCQLNGLSPIYHRSFQTKKNLDLTFSKEKVTGKIISKPEFKAESIDHKTQFPLFDSFYEDIIAMTIDLGKEVLFRFPEYVYERGGTVWSLGEILNGSTNSERIIKFYELNPKKEIVRTTIYTINEKTREILRREYIMGANKIIMKKKS